MSSWVDEANEGQIRILIVEDEPMNRSLLRAVLARATQPRLRSAAVEEAETLAGARAALRDRQVDILVLDVRLPDGSGLDLANELAGRPDAERPCIVILSASVLPGEREAALSAGCDAFVAKPYLPAELVDTLARLGR